MIAHQRRYHTWSSTTAEQIDLKILVREINAFIVSLWKPFYSYKVSVPFDIFINFILSALKGVRITLETKMKRNENVSCFQ